VNIQPINLTFTLPVILSHSRAMDDSLKSPLIAQEETTSDAKTVEEVGMRSSVIPPTSVGRRGFMNSLLISRLSAALPLRAFAPNNCLLL